MPKMNMTAIGTGAKESLFFELETGSCRLRLSSFVRERGIGVPFIGTEVFEDGVYRGFDGFEVE